jgi:hypothetical protein
MTTEEQKKMWALMDEAKEALGQLLLYPGLADINDEVFEKTIKSIDRFKTQMKHQYGDQLFPKDS